MQICLSPYFFVPLQKFSLIMGGNADYAMLNRA